MVDIIKQGTRNQVECKHCGSLLGYRPADVQLYHHGKYEPTNGYDVWEPHLEYKAKITCPSCKIGVEIYLADKDLRVAYSSMKRLENLRDHDL